MTKILYFAVPLSINKLPHWLINLLEDALLKKYATTSPTYTFLFAV